MFTRREHQTEDGFVYHELLFVFPGKSPAIRYVTDEVWRSRFSDARSVWKIWNAVRGDNYKEPPLQGRLL